VLTPHPAASTTRVEPPAKVRILRAATALFASEGIRAVGVDRLIEQSSVTKATFYKHFGSKNRLIIDYLSAASSSALAALDARIAEHGGGRDALAAIVDDVRDALQLDDFRGSLFVNAAAEFPDPRDPVRHLIAEHHEAITDRFTRLLKQIEHPLAGEAADELMLAYIGAFTWGHVGDPVGASVAFRRSVERVIDDAGARGR
jgi:AcrR family transcriptional regulator